ncbi:hypothetical protein EDC14_10446 [Hydrogenispora ethanolica]|jgi:hypothetical protein|uniref:Uncharacterized protein n=1 Tax=Hydrogenispora ethanolica TaxID=1082276 RepID=A0A4R1QW18_HYDET|nr:hypothetical protein [Hydrogenispora ethanolica]TCL57857.1 hypothetical protein EDC14_10446 [Hydrogenispora ethanolica]
MKEVFEDLWLVIKTIIEGYVFEQESTGKTGEEKKQAVVTAANDLIDSLAKEAKIAPLLVKLIKFLMPWIVDSLVAKLNFEGKLNAHASGTASATVA